MTRNFIIAAIVAVVAFVAIKLFADGYRSDVQNGDVNMDGLIDILDIVVGINILLNLMEYTDEQYELLDYNQDGVCNILDLVRILNHILEI